VITEHSHEIVTIMPIKQKRLVVRMFPKQLGTPNMPSPTSPRFGRLGTLYLAILLTSSLASSVQADEVRFVTEDGVTYREEYRQVRVPVARQQVERQQQTVHYDSFTTEMKETVQTFYHPVTTYQWVPRWQGPWGMGQPMHLTYERKAVTQWQPYTRTVRVPVTSHQLVPDTRVVETPTRVLGFEDRLELVSRTPVSPSSVPSSAPLPTYSPASAQTVGTTTNLDSDSVRYSATLRKSDGSATYR
jgi:hypothetical protein